VREHSFFFFPPFPSFLFPPVLDLSSRPRTSNERPAELWISQSRWKGSKLGPSFFSFSPLPPFFPLPPPHPLSLRIEHEYKTAGSWAYLRPSMSTALDLGRCFFPFSFPCLFAPFARREGSSGSSTTVLRIESKAAKRSGPFFLSFFLSLLSPPRFQLFSLSNGRSLRLNEFTSLQNLSQRLIFPLSPLPPFSCPLPSVLSPPC